MTILSALAGTANELAANDFRIVRPQGGLLPRLAGDSAVAITTRVAE